MTIINYKKIRYQYHTQEHRKKNRIKTHCCVAVDTIPLLEKTC